MSDELVGRDADRRAVGIDVSVQIDEPGRHELARGVEHAQRRAKREFRARAASMIAIADADVALASERLAWIEHVAAFDHQIELVVRSHDRAGRSDKRRRRGGRSCDSEKLSPAPARRRSAGRGRGFGGLLDRALERGQCRSIVSCGRSRVMKTMRVRRSSLGHSGSSTGG